MSAYYIEKYVVLSKLQSIPQLKFFITYVLFPSGWMVGSDAGRYFTRLLGLRQIILPARHTML